MSQVSPGGRCLWTERLIPSILFKPPHSPSCWTSEAGVVAAHPLGLCGEAQTWYHVRGQSSGDCEAPRKESHITLLHTHPRADTHTGAVVGGRADTAAPRSRPGKEPWAGEPGHAGRHRANASHAPGP